MKKLLFIYEKKNLLKLEKYKDIIDTVTSFDDLSYDNSVYNHNSIIICYGNEYENKLFHFEKNFVLNYSGFIYFDFPPSSDENIEKEIFINTIRFFYTNAFSRIKGKYAIVLHNFQKDEWYIFNDILGLWPTYYYEDDEVFLLSSDIEPLLKYKNNKYNLNIESIYEYILFGSPQNNKTLFKNIQILPPNSFIKIKNKKIKIDNYAKKIKVKQTKDSIEKIAENYYLTLKKETNQILNWTKCPEVCLTGGTDTRMILGVLDDTNKNKSTFVTWTSEFVENEENQDIIIAKLLANKFGLKHKIIKNHLFAFKELNDEYFIKVKNSKTLFISGYLGSETLRFFHSYPTNISYLTRILIESKIKYHNYNDLFYELDFKSKKNAIFNYVNYINKYLKYNNVNIRNLIREIKISNKHLITPFSEIAYTVNYCSRSFFSRHCGGAKNNIILTNNLTRFLVSPFMTMDVLKIIFSINPIFLNHYSDGITNIILKNHFKEFCDIPSNSHLVNFPDTELKNISYGKKNVDLMKLNYQNAYKILKTNKLEEYNSYFDFQKILEDFFGKENSYVWYDLFIFLNYVKNL